MNGEGLAQLKLVLMNEEHRFNQLSWYRQADNSFNIYDWLQPALSVEPLQESRFKRVVVSVEGVEWKEELEIICKVEYEVGAWGT